MYSNLIYHQHWKRNVWVRYDKGHKGILAIFVGKCSSVPTNWIKNLAMTALFLTTNFCVVQYHIYFLKGNQILYSMVVIKFFCNNSILGKIKVSPTTVETNHVCSGTEFFVIHIYILFRIKLLKVKCVSHICMIYLIIDRI